MKKKYCEKCKEVKRQLTKLKRLVRELLELSERYYNGGDSIQKLMQDD